MFSCFNDVFSLRMLKGSHVLVYQVSSVYLKFKGVCKVEEIWVLVEFEQDIELELKLMKLISLVLNI